MRKVIFITLFLLFILSRIDIGAMFLDDETKKNLLKDKQELCKSYSELAGSIMSARQEGTEMSKLMSNSTSPELVVSAYELSRYTTETYKASAISDFANKAYLDCIKQ